MAELTYVLSGQTDFFFPFRVRDADQLTLQMVGGGGIAPGTIVAPGEYSVVGASPDNAGVTVRWQGAPSSGVLFISRYTPVEQLTDFTGEPALRARAVDHEYQNIYEILDERDSELSRALKHPSAPVGAPYEAGNRRIAGVADPIAGSDAATKTYVDTAVADGGGGGGGGGGTVDGVPSVDRMFQLLSYPTDELSSGDAVVVTRYHTTGTARGGGLFRWAPGGDKAGADGGLVIDPDTDGGWDGSSGNLETFLNAQGTGVGTGVWVRVQSGAPNVYWWGATGDAGPAATVAATRAFAALGPNRALWLQDGEFGQGKPALYGGGVFNPYEAGGYPESLAAQISVGTADNPSTRSEPVLRITKWTETNRDTDSGLWDQGCQYLETRKVGANSSAYLATQTVVARNIEGDEADFVAGHFRAITHQPDGSMFALWSYAIDRGDGINPPRSICGHEIDVKTLVDAPWQAGVGVTPGRAIGLWVVTADGSGIATHAVSIGAQTGTKGWRTGVHFSPGAIAPSNAATTEIGNGEQFLLRGAVEAGDRYGGVRFHSGHYHYGISFNGATFENDCAILLKEGQAIRWGDAPTDPSSGGVLRASTSVGNLDIGAFSLNFLSGGRSILWQNGAGGRIQSLATSNPGRIEFDDELGGSITFRIADGTAVLRIRSETSTNPILQRIAGANKAISVGAPDSGGAGFRMLRVSNAGH